MRISISEMARLSGVSIRTLHYYDEIGLLKPSEVSAENGYRYYDELGMERIQQILFYRELDFPLKEIQKIMNASGYNKQEALKKQRELLLMKQKRIERLLSLLEENLKGDRMMSFQEFDNTELEAAKKKYAKEVEERWGNTEAYKENQTKTSQYGKEEWNATQGKMDAMIEKFAGHVGEEPASAEVQALVREWQQLITDNWYECSREILAGLGQMYIADERFCTNMDRYKEGTAKLVSEAIAIYCK